MLPSAPSATKETSPPVWGAWIEIALPSGGAYADQSPPVWGAWIEISEEKERVNLRSCRPPCGGRGLKYVFSGQDPEIAHVAPRVGGVD